MVAGSGQAQMKGLKNLIMGTVIGLAAGLWFGVNLGRHHDLLENPFAQPTAEKALQQGRQILSSTANDRRQE